MLATHLDSQHVAAGTLYGSEGGAGKTIHLLPCSRGLSLCSPEWPREGADWPHGDHGVGKPQQGP